jgi:hypothetical protein
VDLATSQLRFSGPPFVQVSRPILLLAYAMRLTEKCASELVAEWANGCTGIAPAPRMMTAASPFTHSRMVVVTNREKLSTMSTAKEYGLQLRRAMEGLNALAVCVGFDPEENPGFWRREILKLADPHNRTPLQRLTSGLLSRYDIDSNFDDHTSSSSVAYGLATCLATDPGSPAMAVRRQVITQLRDYLLATPPPLKMVLGSTSRSTNGHTWRMCMEVIQDLVSVRAMAPALVNAEALEISVGHDGCSSVVSAEDACFVWDTVREVAKVMPVKVVRIHIEDPQRAFPIIRLRSLLSSLSGTDTVQSMSWHADAISDVTATILCSVVPYMPSLKSLNLAKIRRGSNRYNVREWLSTLGYQWLAFALKRRQMQGLELELSMECKPDGFEGFARAVNDEVTFACLIPEIVREATEFRSFPLGTSATSLFALWHSSKVKKTKNLDLSLTKRIWSAPWELMGMEMPATLRAANTVQTARMPPRSPPRRLSTAFFALPPKTRRSTTSYKSRTRSLC